MSRIDDALQRLYGREAALDHTRTVKLNFAGGISVVVEAPDGSNLAFLRATVRHTGGDDVYRNALSLNFFSVRPVGAWLALDDADNSILLCRVISQDCDASSLDADIAGLIEETTRLAVRLSASAAPHAFAEESISSADLMIRI